MIKHLALAGLLVSGTALAAGGPQVVGINSAILGDVRTSSAAAPQPRPAVLRGRVALADRVQTAARSQLQLLLLDKSVFTVGANARLTIDRFVYDPSGRSLGATVTQGAFRFMSGRPDNRRNTAIKTPVASIGIRGTIVEGVVGDGAIAIARSEPGVPRNTPADPATASLIVLRGPGAETQAGLTPGEVEVNVAGILIGLNQPLQAVYVPQAGAAPIGPFTISLPGLARLQGMIFPSLASRPVVVRSGGGMPYPMPQQSRRPRAPIGAGILIGDIPGGDQRPADGGRYIPTVPRIPAGGGGAPAPQPGGPPPDPAGGQDQPVPDQPAPDPAGQKPAPPPEPVAPPPQEPASPPPQVPGKP